MTKKIIVLGLTHFSKYDVLAEELRSISDLPETLRDIEIVLPDSRESADVVFNLRELLGLKSRVFAANWAGFGKKAGFIRNGDMVNYADALILFADDESRGTKHIVDLCKKSSLDVREIIRKL